MRRGLAEDFVCPVSLDRLRLATAETGPDIDAGELVCAGCGRRWEIKGGVPRLVPSDLVDQQRRTAEAFGYEWRHFDEMHPQYEAQFLDWLYPIGPEFFRDKRVLDAGCGTGRHSYFAAQYGADEVVGLDLSGAVETARNVLAPLRNAEVVQGDLLRPPLRTAADGGGFDFVYSIGVLHHLPDPYEGFRSLLRLVRPGGTIAIWVYGFENNEFVRNVVEPLRRVSTTLPYPVLRILALPLAAVFHGLAKAVYGPLEGTEMGRALPLDEYMASVGKFSFRQNYSIVFDQLVAPTAAYIKGPDVRRWFEKNGLTDVRLSHRHGNSWRASGRVDS